MAIKETSNSILLSVAQVPEHEPKPSTAEEEVEEKKEDGEASKSVASLRVDPSRWNDPSTY